MGGGPQAWAEETKDQNKHSVKGVVGLIYVCMLIVEVAQHYDSHLHPVYIHPHNNLYGFKIVLKTLYIYDFNQDCEQLFLHKQK